MTMLPSNFRVAGIPCGIHADPERRNLALIVSDTPATAAGVFTQNRARAAPVRVTEARLPRDDARGIVICAGNANACTGEQGMRDAQRMTEVAAEVVGCKTEQMLVCSTGVIGRPLPMAKIESGIHLAGEVLGSDSEHLDHMARAILTTDTRTKVTGETLEIDGREVHVTGIAKGAAMIGPNMATMLAFVLTDAAVAAKDLHMLLKRTASQTFNCARVEGHTSTNDTLLMLANGRGKPLKKDGLVALGRATNAVCEKLARMIVADAEGADHLVTVEVEGLRDHQEAEKVARAVCDSALVKTAIFGADPNWGRIVSAAGYAGVPFEEEELSLWLGDILLYHEGTPEPFDAKTASAYLKNHREVLLRLRFTLGSASCRMWTSDLTYEYVRLNAEHTT